MQKWCIPCEVVREKAAAWLEEELSPAETDMIAEHLDKCEECVAFFHSLEQIDLTPPKLRFTTSDDYWQSMDKVLSHEIDVQEKGGKSKPYVMWEFWVLAASALLILSWGIYQYQQVSALEQLVESQQRDLERLQRTYAQPASPRAQPYVMPAVHIPSRMEL